MPKLLWDQTGERFYETGTAKGVIYPSDTTGAYPKGVAWNGLTAVTESPDGAEATDLYANNGKYGTMRSAETFGATIEAYTYPDEFAICDGSKSPVKGLYVGQQSRPTFGFSYVTNLGNDSVGADEGTMYKLHLIYGATASPSEKSYTTINDSPDAVTFSWDVTTTPVAVAGMKPTAQLVLDSTKVDTKAMAAVEAILYGTDTLDAKLPLPDEIIKIMQDAVAKA
jgi:hypothetical protein